MAILGRIARCRAVVTSRRAAMAVRQLRRRQLGELRKAGQAVRRVRVQEKLQPDRADPRQIFMVAFEHARLLSFKRPGWPAAGRAAAQVGHDDARGRCCQPFLDGGLSCVRDLGSVSGARDWPITSSDRGERPIPGRDQVPSGRPGFDPRQRRQQRCGSPSSQQDRGQESGDHCLQAPWVLAATGAVLLSIARKGAGHRPPRVWSSRRRPSN